MNDHRDLKHELNGLAEELARQARLPEEGKPAEDWTEDEAHAVLESMAAEIGAGSYTWADLVREADRSADGSERESTGGD